MASSNYDLLLEAIPKGPEYDAEGQIYPFRDGTTEFSWTFDEANTPVNVYLRRVSLDAAVPTKLADGTLRPVDNAVSGRFEQVASGITSASGTLTIGIQLGRDPGTYELVVAKPTHFDTPLLRELITTRITATIHNAIGATFDSLQNTRNRIRAGVSPTTADPGFLAVHGSRVGLVKSDAWDENSYRAAVVTWMQAQRHYAGVARGVRDTMSSGRGTAALLVPPAWLPGLGEANLISAQPCRPSVDAAGTIFVEDDLQPHAGPTYVRYDGASGGGAAGGALSGYGFTWARRSDVLYQDDLLNANEQAHVCIHPAVASTATPATTFSSTPVQPYDVAIGGDGGSLTGSSVVGTTTAARLTVLFTGVWAGGDVRITGLDVNNIEQTESFPYAGAGLVHGEVWFKTITSIVHATASAGVGTASVGLRDRLFIRILSVSNDDLGVIDSGDIDYDSTNNTLAFANGEAVPIDSMGTVDGDQTTFLRRATLRGRGPTAFLVGGKNQATYSTVGANYLRLSVDKKNPVEIALTSSGVASAAAIATEINAALAAVGEYSTDYSDFAIEDSDVLILRNSSNPLTYGSDSQIRLEKSAYSVTGTSSLRGDFAKRVLGYPRVAAFLSASYDGALDTFSVDAVHSLPATSLTDANSAWTGWIGRGQRINDSTNVALTALDDFTAELQISGSTFINADVGGYLELSGMTTADNDGIHRIVSVDHGGNVCTVSRDSTPPAGFTTETTNPADWIVYSRGEPVEVIDVSGTTITISAASQAALQIVTQTTEYGEGAFLEFADDTGEDAFLGDIIVDAPAYSGEIEVEVNTATDLVPTGDTTDTVTFVGSTVPIGWSLYKFAYGSATYSYGLTNNKRVILTTDSAGDAYVQVVVPGAGRDFPGWRLRASAIVGAHTIQRDVRFDISMDGGTTWVAGTPTTLDLSYFNVAENIGALYPPMLSSTATPTLSYYSLAEEFEVTPRIETGTGEPADVRVRLVFDGVAGADEVYSIDHLAVEVIAHDGQGIARDHRNEASSHWVYYWPSKDPDAEGAASVDSVAYTDTTVPGPGVDTVMPASVSPWPRAMEQAARLGSYSANDWSTVMVSIDTVDDNTEYTFDILNEDGTTYSTVTYTSDGTATVAEIQTGLISGGSGVNDFTADTGVSAEAVGTAALLLTSGNGDPIIWSSSDTRLTFTSAYTNTAVFTSAQEELAAVYPIRETLVRDEAISPSTTAPHDVTLQYASAVEGAFPADPTDDDILLEIPSSDGANASFQSGIAYENTNSSWTWQDNQTVRLDNSIWSTTSTYLLTYRLLARVQTRVYDLSDVFGWEDFLWVLDAPYWHGTEPQVSTRVGQTIGLTFDTTGFAALVAPAATTTQASITLNDGRRTTTLPATAWRWVQNPAVAAPSELLSAVGVAFGIQLTNPGELNLNGVYTLTYNAAVLNLTDTADIMFEVRAGATADDCLAANWLEISPNEPLPLARDLSTGTPANQFFQFRATWTRVDDPERTLLWSLGAKGIRTRGTALTSTTTPGIIAP